MHKQTPKRAFYTLAGCIAALALCVAASLFLLTPAPKAQDVTIPGTRGDIYATVQLPGKLARGEELPLVVLCHGFTGSRSGDGHFAPLAADLAAQGIATVRLDFPGCGNSTEPFTAYTLSNMTDDVESAITYMQQTYGTAAQRWWATAWADGWPASTRSAGAASRRWRCGAPPTARACAAWNF